MQRPTDPLPKAPKAWDQNLASLWGGIASSRGMKIRAAAIEHHYAVDIFRGANFCKTILKNQDALRKLAPSVMKDLTLKTPEDCQTIGQQFMDEQFIFRVQPVLLRVMQPTPPSESPTGDPAADEDNTDSQAAAAAAAAVAASAKWPKKVLLDRSQKFDPDGLYLLRYEKQSPLKHLILAGVIAAILIVCLFPAWPPQLKMLSWYFTVGLSSALAVIIVVRLILFMACWFAGADFWLYPNLFVDDASIIQSFIPLYSYKNRKDDYVMKIARVVCFFGLILAGWQISKTHSVGDFRRFAQQSILDVVEWGENKLAPPSSDEVVSNVETPADAWSTDGGSGGEGVDSEAEDYSCLKLCGFESYDVLQDECLVDCGCMEELLRTKCFARCPQDTREALTEAKLDACYTEEQEAKKAAAAAAAAEL